MKKNYGSTIIEVTLMIPVILGCIYFYIMSMLYLVEHGKVVNELSENLYEAVYDKEADVSSDVNGGIASYEGSFEKYDISLTLRSDSSDPVKSLRRWQLIADTICQGRNE